MSSGKDTMNGLIEKSKFKCTVSREHEKMYISYFLESYNYLTIFIIIILAGKSFYLLTRNISLFIKCIYHKIFYKAYAGKS